MLVNLLLAALAGLGLGVLAAIVLEQLDDSISSPAELERRLGVPALGVVPTAELDNPLAALADRKSAISEAYLSVQTNLEFATSHGAPRTMSVTSTRAGEGKSTTAFALAHALVRTGERRVILVDGDMRSPSVHHMFDIKNTAGLSNFLSGKDDVGALLRPTSLERLTVMTAGPSPLNAAELLSGNRLPILLSKLLEQFDHVVVDSPPVLGLADAPLIGGAVEAVVFAAESHAIRSSTISVAINRLLSAKAKIIGAVLTKFDDKRAFGYKYDYGYGYGQAQPAK